MSGLGDQGASGKSFHVSQVDVSDLGYDKRFYHNNCKTIMIIIGVFIIYYIFTFSFWWGCFALGITDNSLYTYISLGIFGVAVIVSITLV